MRLLNKLTLGSLYLNRKRTIVTIVGILLATALLTAVSSVAVTFQNGIIDREKYSTGDYHYVFYDRTEEEAAMLGENRRVEDFFQTSGIGYAGLSGSVNPDKPYLYLMAMDADGFAHSSVHLTEGRFPVNEGEIVLSKHIRTNGGVTYQVGDVLTLTVCRRVAAENSGESPEDTAAVQKRDESQKLYDLDQTNPYSQEELLLPAYTKQYTVVGITERLHNTTEPRTAPGYTVLTCWDERKNSVINRGTEEVYVRYTPQGLRDRFQTTEDILGIDHGILKKMQEGSLDEEEWNQWFIPGKAGTKFYENSYLIRYESLDFSGSMMEALYGAAGIVLCIIVFTSVFCIHNSFAISITEKMKQYGMLASVGATPRQIKKNVYYEALLLAVIGIPLGILSGLFACAVITKIISGMLKDVMGMQLRFELCVPVILLSVVLAVVTVFLSARKPAKAAAKVSPITAILGTAQESDAVRKKIRTPGYIRRLFGMGGVIAYKNMKRTGKKYRVVAASITVSVTIFVAMYSFIDLAMRATDYYLADGYNLAWNMTDVTRDIPTAQAAAKEDVNSFSIQRQCTVEALMQELNYTDAYKACCMAGEPEGETYLTVCSLGEEEYQRYLKKSGISYDQAKDNAVLVNQYLEYDVEKKKYEMLQIYDYRAGDEISGFAEKIQDRSVTQNSGETAPTTAKAEKIPVTLKIAAVTDQVPVGFGSRSLRVGLLIVSDAWMDRHSEIVQPSGTAFFDAADPDALQKLLNEDYHVPVSYMTNVAQQERENKSLYTIVAFFLYGFIAVISLIGVTNIFNTITTSMELRSKEFAMLRSVGMTEKEFQRMVRLESLFMEAKR